MELLTTDGDGRRELFLFSSQVGIFTAAVDIMVLQPGNVYLSGKTDPVPYLQTMSSEG